MATVSGLGEVGVTEAVKLPIGRCLPRQAPEFGVGFETGDARAAFHRLWEYGMTFGGSWLSAFFLASCSLLGKKS